MGVLPKAGLALKLLFLAYFAYAGLFIFRNSFVVGGERYFTLFDDAMVSMRYARNFAQGYGLVWNPGGERVEGYTNPLWTLYMSLLHALPVPESKLSLLVQLSGAVFLGLNLLFVKRVAEIASGGSSFVSLSAVFLCAFFYPLNYWGLLGMEVSVLTLLVTASTWYALRIMASGRFHSLPYVLLGVGTLIRPDMAVLLVAFVCFLLVADPQNRKRHLTWGLFSLFFFLALQTGFRVFYYGDPLPNTYYLKMTGVPWFLRVTRGLYVFLVSMWRVNWVLYLVALFGLAFRSSKGALLLIVELAAQVAYSIWVGGDAWESVLGCNRYISMVMPSLFVLASSGLERIGQSVLVGAGSQASIRPRHVEVGLPVAVLLLLLSANGCYAPTAPAEWLLLEPALFRAENARDVNIALFLRGATSSEAKIAVTAAGTVPYFSHRHTIDMLGKSDKRIAHLAARMPSGLRRFISFYPGHSKWDYAYSIGQLKPDVVVQLWLEPQEAKPYLDAYYREIKVDGATLYLLRGRTQGEEAVPGRPK